MFGLDQATADEAQGWSALSAIEAGRCSLQLARRASDSDEAAEHRQRAEEYFRSVMRDHGDLKIARVAAELLENM